MLARIKRIGLLVFTVIIAITSISGCGEKRATISEYPMLHGLDTSNKRIWLVTDYHGVPINYSKIKLTEQGIDEVPLHVYVNESSQFVLKDSTPLTDLKGNYLYWNEQGLVINRYLQIVNKRRLFTLAGRAVHNWTPLTIDFSSPIKVE